MDHNQFLDLSDDVKQYVQDLRDAENYGDTEFSSYDTGRIADILEEQHGAINDLMFENESKQNKILKLQAELQRVKKERDKLMSELATENSCDYCAHRPEGMSCELSGTKNLLVLKGFCHSWEWHGL